MSNRNRIERLERILGDLTPMDGGSLDDARHDLALAIFATIGRAILEHAVAVGGDELGAEVRAALDRSPKPVPGGPRTAAEWAQVLDDIDRPTAPTGSSGWSPAHSELARLLDGQADANPGTAEDVAAAWDSWIDHLVPTIRDASKATLRRTWVTAQTEGGPQ